MMIVMILIIIILDIMLVNPLGFWVAFLDEVSGFMSERSQIQPIIRHKCERKTLFTHNVWQETNKNFLQIPFESTR